MEFPSILLVSARATKHVILKYRLMIFWIDSWKFLIIKKYQNLVALVLNSFTKIKLCFILKNQGNLTGITNLSLWCVNFRKWEFTKFTHYSIPIRVNWMEYMTYNSMMLTMPYRLCWLKRIVLIFFLKLVFYWHLDQGLTGWIEQRINLSVFELIRLSGV